MFVIRYKYPGTANGLDVGEVYVTDVLGHGVRGSAFSHTYRVADALRFTREQADNMVWKWKRNGGVVIPLAGAVDLPEVAHKGCAHCGHAPCWHRPVCHHDRAAGDTADCMCAEYVA